MRTLGLAVLALALISGVAAAADDMATFFPKPQEVSGWSIGADVQTYPGKKVYDLIDGAGEIFMNYNFETAASAEYTGPDDGIIGVEIYQMKTVDDAYGIYSYYRPAKFEAPEISQAAFVADTLGGLWKNVYYVKVSAQESKPGTTEAVKEFLATISRRIPSEGRLSDLFSVVETEGFKKGSTRYLHTPLALKNLHFVSEENVLDLSQETNMVLADYSLKGRDFTAFVVQYPTEKAATAAAAKYAVYLGAHPDAEAAWFKQMGRTIVGTWAGVKASETLNSQDVLFQTMQDIIARIMLYQIQK